MCMCVWCGCSSETVHAGAMRSSHSHSCLRVAAAHVQGNDVARGLERGTNNNNASHLRVLDAQYDGLDLSVGSKDALDGVLSGVSGEALDVDAVLYAGRCAEAAARRIVSAPPAAARVLQRKFVQDAMSW
jgi:hypothetical protein